MKKIFLYISFLFVATSAFAQVKVGSEGNIIATGNYPVAKSSDIKGGVHFFKTIVDRNNLPANFRDTGMIAYVNENNTYYVLIGGIANINWQTWNAGVAIQDGVVSPGIVTWSGQGLKFYISPAIYVIGGKFYNSPLDSVTLDPASAQSRVDLFIVDTTSRAGKITGVADGNLLTPQADPLSQWALTQGIQINPGDTIPSGVTTKTIYDENLGIPNEWSTHTQGTISSDFNDITKPQHGLKAIYTDSYTNNSRFFFNAPSYDVITSDEVLSAWIYLTVPLANNLYVFLYDNGTKAYSSILLSPSNGFNPNLVGQYQLISIPIYSRYWSSNYSGKWDELEFIFTGTGSGGLYVDNISLQKGINNIPPQSGSDLLAYHTATQLSDTSYSLNRPNNTKTVFILEGDTTGSGSGTSIDSTTASNGLTLVGKDAQLGGALTKNTTISAGTNSLSINGTGVSSKVVLNLSSTDQTPLWTTSVNNLALYAKSINGYAAEFDVNPTSTNTISPAVSLFRSSQGTAANGIGTSIEYSVQDAGGYVEMSNQLISKLTNTIHATRTSQFVITGVYNGTTKDLLTLNGNGSVKLNQYGSGTFTGTPNYNLAVDASGNVIGTPAYKVYVARVTQVGTSAPTVDVLVNNTGYAFSFTYVTTGIYDMVCTGNIFLSYKTAILMHNTAAFEEPVFIETAVQDGTNCYIRTRKISDQTYVNSSLFQDFLEVRIYP